MKKILLTTAAIVAISTSAFAVTTTQDKFYLRGDLGGTYFSKFTTAGVKVKPKFGMGVDLGAGYYITDSVRAEIVYNRPFTTPHMNASTSTPAVINAKIKQKSTINAFLARVHGDVIDLGTGKIFLTAGLGWAQVKNSINVSYTTVATTERFISTEHATNLAWTIGAGAAFDVAENVHLDIAYSYRDYGKSKTFKYTANRIPQVIKGIHFRSHNITAGVRFDL